MRNTVNKYFSLIVAIMIPILIGVLSAFLTGDNMKAYADLVQPVFAPPSWIFAPVWTILYLLMGVASWLIFIKRKTNEKNVKKALFTYGLNLFFNFFWSIIFFGLGLRGFAFIEILVLLGLIVLTTIQFYKIDRKILFLMVPYIIWVAFATVLNYSIWMLNK